MGEVWGRYGEVWGRYGEVRGRYGEAELPGRGIGEMWGGMAGHLGPAEQQLARELALGRAHRHVDGGLGLARQRGEHVALEAAHHEGGEQHAALGDGRLVHLAAAEVEGAVEGGGVGEEVGVEEVQQRPQLVQVVLQRRAWGRARVRVRPNPNPSPSPSPSP